MEWVVRYCQECQSGDDVGIVDGRWLCFSCNEAKEFDEKLTKIRLGDAAYWLVCDDCGVSSPEVEDHYDPYFWEVYDEQRPCTLCKQCYKERSYDI